jgi:hypothetical protein
VVDVNTQPSFAGLFIQKKGTILHRLKGGLGEHRASLDNVEKINIFFFLPRFEPHFLSYPASTLFIVPTELSRLIEVEKSWSIR